MSPPRIWKVLFRDFPRLRPQPFNFRLGKVSPFFLKALDQAVPNSVRHAFSITEIAKLFSGLFYREPLPAAERFPASEDLLPIYVKIFPVRLEFRHASTSKPAPGHRLVPGFNRSLHEGLGYFLFCHESLVVMPFSFCSDLF
jgi:hypothetical protein